MGMFGAEGEQKDVRLKAMVPDMDGKQIYVRSEQEQKICFVLSSLGVQFRYEEPYEHPVADAMHSQYRPDFSIYFERDGKPQRLYLEHFGVDEHGFVPAWFAKDRNISYEEANQKVQRRHHMEAGRPREIRNKTNYDVQRGFLPFGYS